MPSVSFIKDFPNVHSSCLDKVNIPQISCHNYWWTGVDNGISLSKGVCKTTHKQLLHFCVVLCTEREFLEYSNVILNNLSSPKLNWPFEPFEINIPILNYDKTLELLMEKGIFWIIKGNLLMISSRKLVEVLNIILPYASNLIKRICNPSRPLKTLLPELCHAPQPQNMAWI